MRLITGIKSYLLKRIAQRQEKKINLSYTELHAHQLASFYDAHFDTFKKVYGDVIQAYRTNDLSKLLDYQIHQIGLKPDHRVLDAGSGVCGPAAYFAKKTGCTIDAVTISSSQAKAAKEIIERENQTHNIKVHVGDFHLLDEMFPAGTFDRIYFLESFGHSDNKRKLLQSVNKVLKPGGEVYIKDLFVRKTPYPIFQKKIDGEIHKINKAYHYNVSELNEFVDMVREAGFVIIFIKTIDIALDDFENLAISNQWQELTGIAQVKDWNNYIFPIDFFEIKLYKLEYDSDKGKHRYFIQNLFQIKVNDTSADKLGY
jgi:cyclopropane fatty-acyl-phospholipid synthase-like methyltransferase